MDLAMQMTLLVVKATLLLALATCFLYIMQRWSTAASRHFVCASALALLILLPAGVFVPLPHMAGNWTVFHIAIASSPAKAHGAIWTDWPRILLFVWLGGTVLFALRSVVGWWIVTQRARTFICVDDADWKAGLAAAMRLLGVSDTAIILKQGNVTSPVACGMFSHAILLPQDASDWDAFRRRTVLLHEVAHVCRKDCLWQQVVNFACALFWFHPLAWRLASRLAREQELACDDLALAAGIDRRAYAALLLDAVQNVPSNHLFACAFHGEAPAKHLRARFANVLATPPERHRYRYWTKAFVTALACFVISLSSVSLARAEHVYIIGKGVSAPVLLSKVEPQYTKAARAAKIKGTVLLSVVIDKKGHPEKIHVVRKLDPGLDAKAVEAIKQWLFSPAIRQGKPVAVMANIEVNFRLL